MIGGTVALASGAHVCANALGETVRSSNADRLRKRRKTIMAARATRNATKVNHLRDHDRRSAARERRRERIVCVVRELLPAATLTQTTPSPIS
jgi:hypothetical protein